MTKKNDTISSLIDQYPMDYCHMLALCYGEGMMSEGGEEGIHAFFSGFDLSSKKILEIGYGLGGLAHWLDKSFSSIQYVGLEINPELQAFAQKKYGKENLSFHLASSPEVLDFESESFDLVFSKGVLVHLEDKKPLFSEVFRVLKKEGRFLINDWLSPDGKSFGKKIDHMCKVEGLELYPTSESSYKEILEKAGFEIELIEDETPAYADYNWAVVKRLNQEEIRSQFLALFGEKDYAESLKSYGFITDAFANKETLVRRFLTKKK